VFIRGLYSACSNIVCCERLKANFWQIDAPKMSPASCFGQPQLPFGSSKVIQQQNTGS
jgi:hypothetical protein